MSDDYGRYDHELGLVDNGRVHINGQDPPPPEPPPEDEPLYRLDTVRGSDVTISRVRFVWDGRIPIGAVTLVPGEEGIGKTVVGCHLIARVTNGTLPGEHYGTPRNAIVAAAEDDIEAVFAPRLEHAGADMTRVVFVRSVINTVTDQTIDVVVPDHLPLLEQHIRDENASLVWIDALVSTLPERLKSIAYKDTASLIKQLGNWGADQGVAVVGPWHLNKGEGNTMSARMMDSRGYRTAARSILAVVRDPHAEDNAAQLVVVLDKANGSPVAVDHPVFRMRSAAYTIDEDGETIAASCAVADIVAYDTRPGATVIREALDDKADRDLPPAARWLRTYLTACGGNAPKIDIETAGDTEGFGASSLKRAKNKLRIFSVMDTGRDDDGRPYRRANWHLPDTAAAEEFRRPPRAGDGA